MTLFDVFLIVILFGAGVLGYKRGVIVQLASLFATFVSLLIALLFTNEFAPSVARWFGSENAQNWTELLPLDRAIYSTVAFFILFTITKVILSFFTVLFNRFARFSFLKKVNRLGGILLSLFQTVIIYIFVVHIMNIIPLKSSQELVEDSLIAQGLMKVTPFLVKMLKELLVG